MYGHEIRLFLANNQLFCIFLCASNHMRKVRIKDIAEIADVSIGTVDRVIHKREGVSDATRSRIEQLLEEYKYETDPIASSLALKKEVRLVVFMPGTVSDHVFWDLPRNGLDKATEELAGFALSLDVICFNQFDKGDFLQKVKNFSFEGVHGVLFAPVFEEESAAFIARCAERDIPVVLINSRMDVEGVRSYVGQDAFHSGYVAAKLINYGLEHRRDVVIINMSARKDHYAHLISRELGFRRYFEEHSDRLDNLVTIDLSGVDDAVLYKKLEEVMSAYRVGGFFVSNSRVYKVAEFLAGRGTMSVRLVGYDLLPGSVEYLKRDYIDFLISQRPEEQARLGLNSLFNLVAFNRVPDKQQLMPIDIITRENLNYYKQ